MVIDVYRREDTKIIFLYRGFNRSYRNIARQIDCSKNKGRSINERPTIRPNGGLFLSAAFGVYTSLQFLHEIFPPIMDIVVLHLILRAANANGRFLFV